MLSLDKELAAAGCLMEPDQFRDLVRKCFLNMFHGWTDEDLLCRPRDGLRFCDVVRQLEMCGGLSDYVILRTLTNVRKNSFLVD